jgi:hypothetical protein
MKISKVDKVRNISPEKVQEAMNTIDTMLDQIQDICAATNINFIGTVSDEKDVHEVVAGDPGIVIGLYQQLGNAIAKIAMARIEEVLGEGRVVRTN